MCVCVYCVYTVCLVFIIAAHLDNKVIFYQLSPLTLQVAVKSWNATQTIQRTSVLETVLIWETNLWNTAKGGAQNPSPPALQASTLATQPPWTDKWAKLIIFYARPLDTQTNRDTAITLGLVESRFEVVACGFHIVHYGSVSFSEKLRFGFVIQFSK